MVMTAPQIPVTILTGYLGAGKTTLLNQILTTNHGKKIAVIVNEFGEIGIDQQLVMNADEEIFEMNNGCICCTVRGDLVRIISQLVRRRQKFDHLLIETTGLADPAPVIQTFVLNSALQQFMTIDAIITVVDVKHIHRHWSDREAQEQIAFADVILLNKTDLVTPDELAAVETAIRQINKMAKLHHIQLCQPKLENITQLLNIGGFDLQRIQLLESHDHDHNHQRHDASVQSVAIVEDGSVNAEKLYSWICNLLEQQGDHIFRMKGIINVAGVDERFVFQGIHTLFDSTCDRTWRPGEHRQNQLVFIGRNLNKAQLKQEFHACLCS